jgi:peptidoglycan/xylan/chitin deacetylase (PgdA/CDA1 family)
MSFSEGITVRLISMLRGISNKREFLAQVLGKFGILALLEQFVARRRPGFVVLTYHRIAKSGENLFYDPVISATPDSFRTQIKWLSNHVRLVTLDELLIQLESGVPWSEPAILLTFDDGYYDNFKQAVPILREFSAPATFFIPTAFLDTPQLSWWDQVAYVIKQTQVQRLTVERHMNSNSSPVDINLQTTSRQVAIATIIRAFLGNTISDERSFLDQLTEQAKVDINPTHLGCELFMTWDQIRQLVDSGVGFSVGSHAHSHRNLAQLDHNTQRDELSRSKQTLETKLSRPVKALAYPFGWSGTYTSGTKVLAEEAGYALAFSSREGINRFTSFDRYDVYRLGVGLADSTALIRARGTLHAVFGKSFL